MQKASIFVTLGIVGILFLLIMVNRNGAAKTNSLSQDSQNQDALSLGNNQTSPISERQQTTQQQPPPTQAPLSPTPPETNATVPSGQDVIQKAIIKTSKGDIAIDLYNQDAPKTVENFVSKAHSGFYNTLTFHRVEDWVIQGGDPKGNGTGGGNMKTELNKKPFVVGSVGVARGSDITISNDSQFFITKKDAGWLNGQYTNFGIVTSGMDVVEKIEIGDKILEINIAQ